MIMCFCSFSYFESSVIKWKEEDTSHFLDQSFTEEILRIIYVKPMWQKIYKGYFKIITDVCAK